MNIIIDVYELAGTSTEVSVVESGTELCCGFLAAKPSSTSIDSAYTVFIRYLGTIYSISQSIITNIQFDGPVLIISISIRKSASI